MEPHRESLRVDSSRYRIFTQLKLAIDYCFVLSIPRGAWYVASILVAKLLRRPFVFLPIPGAGRTVRLRTASSDIATYNQVFIRREYDFSDLPYAERFRPSAEAATGKASGITIIDCGANIGCSTLWFASEFPGAEIVAVEPERANFELLKANLAHLSNVRTIRAAVWGSSARVAIVNPHARSWGFQTGAVAADDDPDKTTIDAVTMDALLRDSAPSARLIVKMDIEGAEREVFAKDTSWLQAVDLLIIELHDPMFPWEGNSRTFFSAVARREMDYAWRAENLFCFQKKSEATTTCSASRVEQAADRG
jgi:FkbM family methyltransferase